MSNNKEKKVWKDFNSFFKDNPKVVANANKNLRKKKTARNSN
jgi:hypothetical protein